MTRSSVWVVEARYRQGREWTWGPWHVYDGAWVALHMTRRAARGLSSCLRGCYSRQARQYRVRRYARVEP
jgi:hypothetical protein